MQVFIIFMGILVAILVAAYITYTQSPKTTTGYRPGVWPEADKAVHQAQNLYLIRKEAEVDFSSGPCLSNDLIPGWVADIVHNPRQDIDNSLQNQCPAFLEGRAKHFIELDLEGNLVRVR